MPNHVRNVLTFNNLKPLDIRFLLDTITEPIDKLGEHLAIDFNKIIPQPGSESDCPNKYKVNKDSHITPEIRKPWLDWYKWNCDHWGTKWNAYDAYIITGKSYIKFIFNTAWSTPQPVIEQLKLLRYNFNLKYADEDLGSNCGQMIYNPNKTGFSDIVHICEKDMVDSYKFAKRLWKTY